MKIKAIVAVLIVISIILTILPLINKGGPGPKKYAAVGMPAPTHVPMPDDKYDPKDINHDGAVNDPDAFLIHRNLGCKSTDKCWKERVGLTNNSDNPIYASDLDLNHDNQVTQADADLVPKGQ
ncbi:hypothetical protein HYS00_00410 [Candidatus Microgenomates bacterium]|nr:hypothetical protein [Candidatus Microgenomates bacterium]